MSQKVLNELSKVGRDLMLKQPFYGMYLLMLDKRVSNVVPTAGVSKQGINYRIDINPDFWEKLSHEHRLGLIHHELLHICFFHLLRREEFENHMIANIAMDIEINQYIPSGNLPEGGMTLNTFPELKLEPKKGTRYYYDKLMEQAQKNDEKIQQMLDAMANGDMTDGDGNLMPNHEWEDFDELSDTEKKLLGAQIDHHLKELANQMKSRGSVPGEMKDYIDSLFTEKPSKFDWKGYLRRFSGGSSRVYTKKLQRKENRRYADDAGLKIKQRRHMLLAIDTSGSVSQTELEEFLNEIGHIHKTGTEVTVLQCDTRVTSVELFNPKKKFVITGRGGTDFQPIIDYANSNSRKFTGLCIFTDGEAPAPTACTLRTLWVHSSASSINKDLQGYKIKLEL